MIGSIHWENIFSSKARALINGKLFILKRDFFRSRFEIYDSKDQSLLGMILVNVFYPKSEIVINGKRFELVISNLWQSKWSWRFNNNEIITFITNDFLLKGKGEIHLFTVINEEIELLILLGIYIRNQFFIMVLILLIMIVLITV